MSDPRVLVIAEIHGRAGLGNELQSVLAQLARATREEPECVGYRVLGGEEPTQYVLLGSWASEAGLRGHYQTAHYRQYRAAVGALLARASDVVVHHVQETVHALDPDPPDPALFG
jgi:quinol monooxygenase YgiN